VILSVLITMWPVTAGGILHMLVVRADRLRAWALPLDGGRRLRGRRILGEHKTWRGLAVIVSATTLLTGAQRVSELAWPGLAEWNLVDLDQEGWWHAGLVWGFSYALAELPNSFIKRQIGIPPGAARGGWTGAAGVLLDQADSAIGCALGAWLFLGCSTEEAVWLASVCTALHLLINLLLGATRVRRRCI
jgi:hypothetical protein